MAQGSRVHSSVLHTCTVGPGIDPSDRRCTVVKHFRSVGNHLSRL